MPAATDLNTPVNQPVNQPVNEPVNEHTRHLGHGVYLVDTGFERPEFDAAYLVVSDGRAAFIDTGHNAAVPRLLAALDSLGLARDAVDWVIPTHVHLDHAGGAGLLMSQLPVAQALIHPRGARHLINPLALVEGARMVYGPDVVRQTYGTIEPIAAECVVESHDDMVIHVGSRALRLIDTPGHARHHHCIWDARSRGWFTGDTFGISYREFDGPDGAWLFPSSTPVQFEPDALRRSIQRLLDADPQVIYPTHFGAVTDLPRVSRQFLAQLDEIEQGALALARAGAVDSAVRQTQLQALIERVMLTSARAAGSPVSDEDARRLLLLDTTLNAQGVAVWLSKLAG